MKKSSKKSIEVVAKGTDKGTQGTLFGYDGLDKKGLDEKDKDKSDHQLFTKGRPFTITI